jgi:hypothetical protein
MFWGIKYVIAVRIYEYRAAGRIVCRVYRCVFNTSVNLGGADKHLC